MPKPASGTIKHLADVARIHVEATTYEQTKMHEDLLIVNETN